MRHASALAFFMWVTALAALGARSATWTDGKYGYSITYPTSINLVTDRGELQRHFSHPPRFLLTYAANDVSDEFMIVEVREAGAKSSQQYAESLARDERRLGSVIVSGVRPVTVSGRAFYVFTTNTNGTVVHHYTTVHNGSAFDFKVEDRSPGPAARVATLERIVRTVRF